MEMATAMAMAVEMMEMEETHRRGRIVFLALTIGMFMIASLF